MCDVLRFENVSKTFGSVRALSNISFQIPKNKIVGLVGANGAGKTTIMRLIIRYLSPDSGNIFMGDMPVNKLGHENFPITYIPDVPVYYEELSVLEHLTFISSMYGTQAEKSNLIRILELKEHLDKVPSILSKGNKQKLSIACAILRNYEILIADEPFSGLDPRQIKVLKDILLENKAQGKTVIISTHLLDMLESFCDEYIMIDKGELLSQGTFEHIVSNNKLCNSLEELYLYLTEEEQIVP